jgi:RNase P protein component
LKLSLDSQKIGLLLFQSSSFKSKQLSFKYANSSTCGIGFSINRSLGCAVLRNSLKREARRAMVSSVFKNHKINVLLRPLSPIKKGDDFSDDFLHFKEHLDLNNK